jgi:redox-sensing transcriptional repressor
MGAGNLGLGARRLSRLSPGGIRDCGALRRRRREDRPRVAQRRPIHDIKELRRVARKDRLDIAVIAVPAPRAQPVRRSGRWPAGIKAILNFSPGALTVPPNVKLKSVDLTVSLESLSVLSGAGRGQ